MARVGSLPGSPALRGRGAAINPTNRFESLSLSQLPGEHQLEQSIAPGEAAEMVDSQDDDGRVLKTAVYRDRSQSIINPVDSPDLHFKWTINAYRGCEHGCIYCYARPGHEYLGLSCGVDFESKIIVKHDAALLFRRELNKPSWHGEPIMMSGVTDPYQPIERSLRITRALLEVAREFRQPVSIITKNRLVTRDIDLLGELAAMGAAHVAISLTTLDPHLAQIMEPRASSPDARLSAIEQLAGAGIPVAVMTAPIIPGINDHELPALLEAAKAAGASSAGYVMVRLPHQIKDLFADWLDRHFPDRSAKVQSLIRQTRAGELYDATYGQRQTGTGPIAEVIESTFRLFATKLGLMRQHRSESSGIELGKHSGVPLAWDRPTPFCRPAQPSEPVKPARDLPGQLGLFGR